MKHPIESSDPSPAAAEEHTAPKRPKIESTEHPASAPDPDSSTDSPAAPPTTESSDQPKSKLQKEGGRDKGGKQKAGKWKREKIEWTPREKKEGDEESDRRPKRKVALLMSFCGTGYKGMQINPGSQTIEGELFKALATVGAVSKDNCSGDSADPHKISFMRAARTDKGVHAAGQVVSLKMIIEDSDIIKQLNDSLPAQIRVWDYVRVTNGFHAKNQCDSRIYEYLLPTYVLESPEPRLYPNSTIARKSGILEETKAPRDDQGFIVFGSGSGSGSENTWDPAEAKRYRVPRDKLERLALILQQYKGTNNYHNFTVGKRFSEKSATRYIISFEAGTPFVEGDLEWVSLKVHGQAFMIHQIRKMVGLAVMMVRTETPISLMTETFTNVKINIPKVPGLGLLLEQTIFKAYNDKIASKEERPPVAFTPYQESIDKFKREWIYSKIVEEELAESTFHQWLDVIDSHSGEYSWWLRADGKINLDEKPAFSNANGKGNPNAGAADSDEEGGQDD